ncbi:hypothetical protein HQ314_06190 [Rhodococcus sp. BP-332]|uniref:hypothetical protein n=1 Tax=Rhodococcus sp. BP-332 TaxID=2739447 RepID=UPI001C9ACCF6|nr:hypothetical protein [Rhodococcus sp. BP-332]MBY6676500.1 hypothetical protein [Rhodococcus sp. BP-332]
MTGDRGLFAELSATAELLSRTGDLDEPSAPAPWLVRQVLASQHDDEQLAHWTSSTVIDDNVQAPVFDEATFAWLHRGLTDVYDFPIGHAGLMHTYGYLLSTVVTPYGLKRQRWLTSDLAVAFGKEPTHLQPTPSGTPLMERVASTVLPALSDPVGTTRVVLAFDEVVDTTNAMRTVYVADPGSGSTAVVYGLVTSSRIQIVSTFPVQPLTQEWARTRLSEPTRYRFNYAPPTASPGSAFDGSTEVLVSRV